MDRSGSGSSLGEGSKEVREGFLEEGASEVSLRRKEWGHAGKAGLRKASEATFSSSLLHKHPPLPPLWPVPPHNYL